MAESRLTQLVALGNVPYYGVHEIGRGTKLGKPTSKMGRFFAGNRLRERSRWRV